MKKFVTASPRILQLTFCVLLVLGLLACAPKLSFKVDSDASLRLSLEKTATFPQTKFVVFSDPHIYDPNLGTTGKAFNSWEADERKLEGDSTEIMDVAVDAMKDVKASFVLCCGDLSSNGERQSHLLMAQYLDKLRASGKKIYVVPGNHDVSNGYSYRYTGDFKERVPNITSDEFVRIYSNFGFSDALERDNNSLSYLAEPLPGLWLLALDSTRYKENVEDKQPVTGGRFSPATMQWIEDMLLKASRQNKAVIVMMHHGAVEHYTGQAKTYSDYLVDNYQEVARLFALYNVRMVFTGHFHAQNIAVRTLPEANKFVFDVETGSLVTYPCPYRTVEISDNQQATIQSIRITATKSHPQDFQDYAKNRLVQDVVGTASTILTGYGDNPVEAKRISMMVADAIVAHYSGDAKLAPGQLPVDYTGISPIGWILLHLYKPGLIEGLWTNLPPPDNNVTLDLRTGAWQ